MDLALPPMPFSAVFRPHHSNSWLRIPEEFQTPSTVYDELTQLQIPAGVVQVIVTWQGTESLIVRHFRGGQFEDVATIPSASSPTMRSTGVLTLASEDVQALLLANAWGATWSSTTIDREYVVGVQVMPMGTAADVTGGGSMLRVDNSVGTRVFLGDQMIYGDTGLRAASSLLQPGWRASQQLSIRRVGDVVYLTGYVHSDGTATSQVMMEIPRGFHSVGTKAITAPTTAGYPADVQLLELSSAGLKAYGRPLTTKGTIYIEVSWVTNYSWPSSLPGTAL